MSNIVPLISSGTAGPLGVLHLPRLMGVPIQWIFKMKLRRLEFVRSVGKKNPCKSFLSTILSTIKQLVK